MGWESSDVFIFDLGPLLQGQTKVRWIQICIGSRCVGLVICEVDLSREHKNFFETIYYVLKMIP